LIKLEFFLLTSIATKMFTSLRCDKGIEKKLTESDWGRCVVKM